jgi:hypothetical protein
MKMTLKFWTDKPGEKPVSVVLDTESKFEAEAIAFDLACVLGASHTWQSIEGTSVYTASEPESGLDKNGQYLPDHPAFEFQVV